MNTKTTFELAQRLNEIEVEINNLELERLKIIKVLQERIEYLERSNNRREETIELERKENLELHNKIDKAIEYIDRHIRLDDEYPAYMELLIEERDELLEILKDSDVDD